MIPRKFLIGVTKFLIETHRANKLILQVMKVVFLSYPKLLQKDKDLFLIGLSKFKYFEDFIEKLGVYDPEIRKEIAKLVFHLVDSMIHRHVLEVAIAKTDDALAQSLSDIIMEFSIIPSSLIRSLCCSINFSTLYLLMKFRLW